MKKFIFLLSTLLLSLPIFANNLINYENRESIYLSIDFKGNQVDQHVFDMGLKGYLKMKASNQLKNDNILSIIDYSKHSIEKRFWVIDLSTREVLYNEWVSHGKYTGNAIASKFSNIVNSKQSSLGFFVTDFVYDGKHKRSLKLRGVEKDFNSNAFKRGIVIHGADYVCSDFIKRNNRLGRSYGCPAVRQKIKDELINTIKDGSCLFSYYPSQDYLTKSNYLN